jgi:hypothetical protein
MPLTPETTKNDKTPKKEKIKAPTVSKTSGSNRYTDYMTPEEWVKLNAEKGYIESPVKSKTKYPVYYDSSKYIYAAGPEAAGGYERWYKKGDEGTLTDYSKLTDYFPEEIYGGPRSKPYVVKDRGAPNWKNEPPKLNLPKFIFNAGEGTYEEQENAYKEANNLDKDWRPKTIPVTLGANMPATTVTGTMAPQVAITPTAPLPNEVPVNIPQNKAKGGKIMAPKVMNKYVDGGDVVGYNYQGQPIDRYGKIIQKQEYGWEQAGGDLLKVLPGMSTAASSLMPKKEGQSSTTNDTQNTSADTAKGVISLASKGGDAASVASSSGGGMEGAAASMAGGGGGGMGAGGADLLAKGVGIGAGIATSSIDNKNKDARGRYKSQEAAMGSSAIKGAALGTQIGANPALVAATGGMSVLAGAGLGALGGGIYGAVRGKKDVESIKESETKMKSELAKANTLTNQQRAVANREAGILEGNLATPLTEKEAIYNEKDELINPARYAKGGVIGAAKMRYAKGGTIVGKGGPKDDAIFTNANEKGIAPGSFIVPAENEEKAKGIRAALFGNKNQIAQFKKGGETESNVAVSNGEHLFTPKERKKIINYLGEEILEELAPNAEENAEYYNGGMIPENVATQKRTEQIQDSYAGGGTTGDGLNKDAKMYGGKIMAPKMMYANGTPKKGSSKIPKSVRFVPKMVDESEGEDVIVPGVAKQETDFTSIIPTLEDIEAEKKQKIKASLARIPDSNTPPSPPAPKKGLADYVKNIDPGAAFSAYQIGQGSKLLKSGQRPEDVSKIDPAYNAAVERAQRDATFGYTPEQAAMLDQKAINALNDARFSGRNLAGGSAGTAFQQERQAINQGWSNALQLKSADQQLRMQKQQYADQAVKERADFLDMQRRRAFGDAMNTYNVNQESGSALVGAGVRNAIGAFRYQKELDAQERAAKIAGAPITTG